MHTWSRRRVVAASLALCVGGASAARANHTRYAAAGRYRVFNPYARTQSDWSKPDVRRLILFGDSYSHPVDSSFVNLWPQQLRAEASARELVDMAVVGATAADRPINGLLRPFSAQVSLWLGRQMALGPRDLMAVYFGQNDIYHFGSAGPSLTALGAGLDRLIAAGATAGGRRLLLVLVHDVQRNPNATAISAPRYTAWVPGVAALAAARPNVLMVDLTTAFNRVFANPGSVQLTNVTTPDLAGSATTALFSDIVHFGFRGHQLIGQVIRHYLTRGWDDARLSAPGSDAARQWLNQAMLAGNVFRRV